MLLKLGCCTQSRGLMCCCHARVYEGLLNIVCVNFVWCCSCCVLPGRFNSTVQWPANFQLCVCTPASNCAMAYLFCFHFPDPDFHFWIHSCECGPHFVRGLQCRQQGLMHAPLTASSSVLWRNFEVRAGGGTQGSVEDVVEGKAEPLDQS